MFRAGGINTFVMDLKLGHFCRLKALIGVRYLEFHAVALFEGLEPVAIDAGKVDKHILSTLILGDETKTFFIIKPFNCTLRHLYHLGYPAGTRR
jgi:hypothetical protein